MRHPVVVSIGVALVFLITAGIMWKVMPYPRKDIDYLVIGGAATIVAMAVLFIVLINTSMKSGEVFFKRRK